MLSVLNFIFKVNLNDEHMIYTMTLKYIQSLVCFG